MPRQCGATAKRERPAVLQACCRAFKYSRCKTKARGAAFTIRPDRGARRIVDDCFIGREAQLLDGLELHDGGDFLGGNVGVGHLAHGIPRIPANRLLVKQRSALGSTLRYFRWHAPDKLRASVAELCQWYQEGKLTPCITHCLPLERSREAIRLLTDRQAYGKVVIIPA